MIGSLPLDAEVVTREQLGRASARFVSTCTKNAKFLPKDATQRVLKEEGDQLAREMFEVLRARVERHSKIVVRRVTVNRDLTPEQMIEAAGYADSIYWRLIKNMPRQGAGIEEVDVYFFNPGRLLTNDELEKVLVASGLERDCYAQIQANIDDPSIADKFPNGVQWDNIDGKTSYVVFGRGSIGNVVRIARDDRDWDGGWWFAGVRKVS